MTRGELRILEYLADAWEEYKQLPDIHPSDCEEFAHYIHILQRHVLAREGQRCIQHTKEHN